MALKISKILFLFMSGVYLILFIGCEKKTEDYNSVLMKKEKNFLSAKNYLIEKYNTRLLIDSSTVLTNELQKNILKSGTVVLDSIVKSFYQQDGKYFLNVEVCGDSSQKIIARLNCDEEIKKSFREINHSSLLIAARITRVEELIEDYVSEDDLIHSSVVLKREEIVLYGECYELLKKPDVYDFDKMNDEG